MNSAAELLDEVFEKGLNLSVKDGSIVCRSQQPIPVDIITRIRTHKAEIIDLLQRRQQKHDTPYLKNGELRVRGLLPPGTMLDTLLELGASDEIIERYIGPHLTVKSWQRWQEIRKKGQRVHDH